MGLILNLETATSVCSVALGKNGDCLSMRQEAPGHRHGDLVFSFAGEVLQEAGFAIRDLDAVAVSSGPGSYTGLRIGVSAAKGFCFGLGIPLISVPTLPSMASAAILERKSENKAEVYIPMLDARRMEVYAMGLSPQLETLLPVGAFVLSKDFFQEQGLEKEDNLSRNYFVFGSGALKFKSLIQEHPNLSFSEENFVSAVNMVPFSEEAYSQKKFEDISSFEPFYLKDFYSPGKIIPGNQP